MPQLSGPSESRKRLELEAILPPFFCFPRIFGDSTTDVPSERPSSCPPFLSDGDAR
jgi:hypothetical protein